MRIVFLGSPAFALPALQALIESTHEVVAVVTQPDRPAGRGHTLAPPPVKTLALRHRLSVLQPERISEPEAVQQIRELEPDAMVVAAYGQILRQRLLDVPKRGSLNVHASLLPRHRGAAPIPAAILAGDEVTGVTIMEVVRALDAGPMVARAVEPISPFDTAGTLEPRIAAAGAMLLMEVLEPWADGRITPARQDEALSTYVPVLKREQAFIDWTLSAVAIWRQVRAFNPWPVAYTNSSAGELRILEAWPLPGDSGKPPGTVLDVEALPDEATPPSESSTGPTFSVQAGAGRLAIIRLQRPGGKPLKGADFLRGQRDIAGRRLGEEKTAGQ